MLAAHPSIVIPPESEFIVKLYPKFGHIESFNIRNATYFLQAIHGVVINVEEQWEIDVNITAAEFIGKNYAQVCALLYCNYMKKKNMSGYIWGDKNNCHGNYIDVLASIFPKGRFIHLVRDGRACLNSYKNLNVSSKQKYAPLLSKDTRKVAKDWVNTVDRIDRHLKRYVSCHQHITIRYEDILSYPENKLKEVCEFLNIEFNPVMLEYYQENNKNNLEPKNFSWKENTFKPLDPKKAHSWRFQLSDDDIALFDLISTTSLQRYGYLNKKAVYTQIGFSWSIDFLKENVRHIRHKLVQLKLKTKRMLKC